MTAGFAFSCTYFHYVPVTLLLQSCFQQVIFHISFELNFTASRLNQAP